MEGFFNVIANTNNMIALATVGLFIATVVLAIYTRSLARNARYSHVDLTIEPNKWSLVHFDMRICNSGNSSAYDVQVNIKPCKEQEEIKVAVPITTISMLRPNQTISSYFSEYKKIEGVKFIVEIKWKKRPTQKTYEEISYQYDLKSYEGIERLGEDNELVQMANCIKKMQEDFKRIVDGHRRIKTETMTQQDIAQQRAEQQAERAERRASQNIS